MNRAARLLTKRVEHTEEAIHAIGPPTSLRCRRRRFGPATSPVQSPVLMLLFSGVMKLAKPAEVVDGVRSARVARDV